MTHRGRLLSLFASTALACGGPVETPVVVFDAGFVRGEDAAAPDAADDPDSGEAVDAGPDAGPDDLGFIDGGAIDGGFIDGGAVDGGFIDGGLDEDGGFIDGGAVDGGFVDGGAVDGGFADGGVPDTGVFPDAEVDAGDPDAGEVDGGEADAGDPDTGVFGDAEVDAGPADTGVFGDAEVDAGPLDTGVFADAAVDAGPDAGPPDAAQPPPTSYTRRLIDDQFQHGQHVNAVDIDADGDLDVVASISLTDTVRLYLNGGDSLGGGTGATWSTVQVAPNNSIVAMGTAVADFDGDTDLDVVAIGFFDRNFGFNSAGDMTLYLQGANATQWTAVPVPVGNAYWGPRVIAAGDLTGDGLADVVTGAVEMYDIGGNVQGHGVRWHRNTAGNFTAATDIDAQLRDVEGVVVADVDLDGVPDIVACGRNSGQVVWYENSRVAGQVDVNPTFTRHVLASVFMPGHVTLGQLDDDPALEAVVVHDDSNGGALAWYDAPANPRGLWTRNLVSGTFGGSGGVIRLSVGDLNADGRNDIAAASAISNQVRAYVRTANGWSDQLVRNQTGADAMDIGDIDRDGDEDPVGTTYNNTGTADRVDWYQTNP